MNDAILLEREVDAARGGDAEAFRRVVERTAATVSSIAFAIVRNAEASEDVAQEVFLAAWRNLPRLRDARSFLPWLRQITRNTARSFLRRRDVNVEPGYPLETLRDVRRDPAEQLLRDEEESLLRKVLDNVPDETREIVLLYYREGSSTKHVAELLGMSEPAVRQRLSRARAAIRAELLDAFAHAAQRSAPGVVFVAAVAAAVTSAAPTASAAPIGAAASAGGASKSLLALKAAGGVAIGAFGIFMSLVHLGTPFDDEEKRALHRLAAQALTIVVIFCVAFAAADASGSRWWRLAAYLAYIAAMTTLYRIRLPKIVQRRYAWEESVDPLAAARHQRAWSMWRNGELARALASAIAGGVIFSLLVHALR